MHGCVEEAVEDDQPSGDLVEVDVLVQGQDEGQAQLSKLGDACPEHDNQDEHRCEVETLAWGWKKFQYVSGLCYKRFTIVIYDCKVETLAWGWKKISIRQWPVL